MRIYGKTDPGLVRKSNQDSFDFKIMSDSFVWAVVCDGVGGTNFGDIASNLATATVKRKMEDSYSQDMTADSIKILLKECIESANIAVFDKSHEDAKYAGMGTTMVLVAIKDNIIYVAHVGDSRAYLMLENNAEQLTVDHSIVQEMVKSGEITDEEARIHPQKNIITRALGTSKSVKIDYVSRDFPKDGSILICTDGLSNYMNKEELLTHFKEPDKKRLVELLINKAKDMGGSDNITAVVVGR